MNQMRSCDENITNLGISLEILPPDDNRARGLKSLKTTHPSHLGITYDISDFNMQMEAAIKLLSLLSLPFMINIVNFVVHCCIFKFAIANKLGRPR